MNRRSGLLLVLDVLVFAGVYLGLRELLHRPPIPVTAAVLLALFLAVFWYHRLYRLEAFCNRIHVASRVMRSVPVVFVLFWGTWWFLLKTQWPEASRLLLLGLFGVFGFLYPLTLRMAAGRGLLRRTRVWTRLSGDLLEAFQSGPRKVLARTRELPPGRLPDEARGALVLLEFQPGPKAVTRADLWGEYCEFMREAKADALRLGATVMVFNPYNAELNHEGTVMDLGGVVGLSLSGRRHVLYRRVIKPLLDRLIALILLPVLGLLHPLVALIVRLEFGAPVVFRQLRLGRNGRTFPMLKYRTMRILSGTRERDVDTRHREYIRELLDEEAQTRLDTARLVPVAQRVRKLRQRREISLAGALLRKTSLDELPQVINVLTGRMSFVGPRPALAYEVKMYPPWAELRLRAPQGITGLWQVSGRGLMPMHTSLFLDGYYALEHDLWLDLLIAIRTLRSLFAFSRVY